MPSFVDVIFALAVFVSQRDQRLRDPLTGIDEDLTVLGSLGKSFFSMLPPQSKSIQTRCFPQWRHWNR